MAKLVEKPVPNTMPSRFGDIIGWSCGQIEPGGPPGVKIEWPDTPEGKAACKAFVARLFDEPEPAA